MTMPKKMRVSRTSTKNSGSTSSANLDACSGINGRFLINSDLHHGSGRIGRNVGSRHSRRRTLAVTQEHDRHEAAQDEDRQEAAKLHCTEDNESILARL